MNDVSLRDFIEAIVREHEKRRDDLRAEDRRRFEEYKVNAAQALGLQAKEYERRLKDLNHAHAEAQRVLGTYMPREMYERAQTAILEWQSKADLARVEMEARIKSVELGLVNLPGGIKSLELGLAAQSGQHVGSRMTTATAIAIGVAILSALGGLIGLLSYLTKG